MTEDEPLGGGGTLTGGSGHMASEGGTVHGGGGLAEQAEAPGTATPAPAVYRGNPVATISEWISGFLKRRRTLFGLHGGSRTR